MATDLESGGKIGLEVDTVKATRVDDIRDTTHTALEENVPQEKISLGVNLAQAKTELAAAMPTIAAKYNAIAEGDADNLSKPDCWEQRVFYCAKLPSEIDATVLASKRFVTSGPEAIDDGAYPPHIPNEKKEYFQLFIQTGMPMGTSQIDYRELQGRREAVAAFFLRKKGDLWLITHREVAEAYREQRIGSLLFEAIYDFMQAQANATGRPQKLFAHIGQPSTLKFFGKKQFKPRTDEDLKRAMEIMNGHPDLTIEHAQIRVLDDDGNFTGKMRVETNKDPFVFHKDTPGRTELDCYYLELEKTFVPKFSHA